MIYFHFFYHLSYFVQFSQNVIGMYVKMVEIADNMYCLIFATVFQDSVDHFVRVRRPHNIRQNRQTEKQLY